MFRSLKDLTAFHNLFWSLLLQNSSLEQHTRHLNIPSGGMGWDLPGFMILAMDRKYGKADIGVLQTGCDSRCEEETERENVEQRKS